MISRARKVLILAFLSTVLIVGSFAEDNFGLTQRLIEISDFILCDFCSLHMPGQYVPNAPLVPDTAIILLTTLLAVVLIVPHLVQGKRERSPSPSTMHEHQVLFPSWKVPFKKYKYRHSGSVLPKRHAKYQRQRA